jgi:hypothetical protein
MDSEEQAFERYRARAAAEAWQAERAKWRELAQFWRRMAHRFATPKEIIEAIEAGADAPPHPDEIA